MLRGKVSKVNRQMGTSKRAAEKRARLTAAHRPPSKPVLCPTPASPASCWCYECNAAKFIARHTSCLRALESLGHKSHSLRFLKNSFEKQPMSGCWPALSGAAFYGAGGLSSNRQSYNLRLACRCRHQVFDPRLRNHAKITRK